MAFRFGDSFTNYNPATSAQMLRKWSTIGVSTASATGRFSGTTAWNNGGSSSNSITKVLDSQATWIVSFAFKCSALLASPIVSLRDSASDQCELRITSGGNLTITRNSTVIVGPSTIALTAGVWHHLQFKVTISNASGTAEVKLNGTTVLSGSSLDTQNTANASADRVNFSGTGAFNMTIGDVVVFDGTGATSNNFPGDVRAHVLKPNGAGNSTQFTPSAGANYECVDETTPDDDTSYVSSSTAGHVDTYGLENLPSIPSGSVIVGVIENVLARKDDVGTRELRTVARTASTNYTGSTVALGTDYGLLTTLRDLNPNTSAAWTEAGVNGIETGMEIVT